MMFQPGVADIEHVGEGYQTMDTLSLLLEKCKNVWNYDPF
jgi:hypothetical protein